MLNHYHLSNTMKINSFIATIVVFVLITIHSSAFVVISKNNRIRCEGIVAIMSNLSHLSLTKHMKALFVEKSNIRTDTEQGLSKVMEILSANFKAHALHTFVKLDIPTIMGNKSMSIKEISNEIRKRDNHAKEDGGGYKVINEDALLRTMRLLTTIDLLHESCSPIIISDNIDGIDDNNCTFSLESEALTFQLSSLGKQLQNSNNDKSNLSSCILHWMEKPLHDSWYQLPEYILGKTTTPFESANKVSSDFFYNKRDNPISLKQANDFVKLISDIEIQSILQYYDWSALEGKTIVDIGGYNGKVMGAIASHFSESNFKLISLDLPGVIEMIDKSTIPSGVELIKGDIMKPSTIPQCDVIFMKHFMDRCMWTEEETVKILKTCSNIISHRHGIIILGEAVIPSTNDDFNGEWDTRLSMDALYLLVGRERQRTSTEWKILADKADLNLDSIIPTSSPSCYLIVLSRKI